MARTATPVMMETSRRFMGRLSRPVERGQKRRRKICAVRFAATLPAVPRSGARGRENAVDGHPADCGGGLTTA